MSEPRGIYTAGFEQTLAYDPAELVPDLPVPPSPVIYMPDGQPRLALTLTEAAKMLGIESGDWVGHLTHVPGFPVLATGRFYPQTIRIPVLAFVLWLNDPRNHGRVDGPNQRDRHQQGR
jgi:hypothetical protein